MKKMKPDKLLSLLIILAMVLIAGFTLPACSRAIPAAGPTPMPDEPTATVPENSSNQAVIVTPEPEEEPMPYVIVTPPSVIIDREQIGFQAPFVIVTPTPSGSDYVKPAVITPTQQSEHQTLAMEIFYLTNKVREEGGLNRLTYAYDLQDAADTRAYECSIQFSHTRPDGTSCHDIVTRDYYVTGENLILADKPIADAETLMARWMLSKGHRENIMLPEFTELAVGVYEKNGTVFAAQIFIG